MTRGFGHFCISNGSFALYRGRSAITTTHDSMSDTRKLQYLEEYIVKYTEL